MIIICTNKKCNHLFIAYYSSSPGSYRNSFSLEGAGMPFFKDEVSFDPVLNSISEGFINIYNQAYRAEKNNLLLICGAGYRKALEFLVKDYLIKSGSNKTSIQDLYLADAIKKIHDKDIITCAERAAWLGNDHSHYRIKFTNKDLSHLKDLIDSVASWIVLKEKTKSYRKIKPKKRK